MGDHGEELEAVTEPFTQSDKDYFMLMARSLSSEQRNTIAIVLSALADVEGGFSPAELREMAKLVRGEPS